MKRIVESILRVIGVRVSEQPRRQVVWRPGWRPRVERRRETRSPRISPCTYGLMRSTDPDGVMLQEGYGTAVDDSPTGMRLLLGIAPTEGQILEIQTGHLTLGRAIYLVEVCWIEPLRDDGWEALYLIGCRLRFGPMRSEADLTDFELNR